NREADVQYPNAGFFFPFEGTKLREVSIEQGLFSNESTRVFTHTRPALQFPNLTERELIEMKNTFVLYVKLPEAYHEFIKRSETDDAIGHALRTCLLAIFESCVWKNEGWFQDDGRMEINLKELEALMQPGPMLGPDP
ncbi:MAG: hypothetical protein PHQ23_11130, partial [Candidatus Wallbacteria bacterium]|nr:hypothetical protein [Candidatus Wallbacteria bacterium]